MTHTPGPWTAKGHFVTAQSPIDGGPNGSDAIDHYGGHLVCESVSEANGRLIAAAPDLLEACRVALELRTRVHGCSHADCLVCKEIREQFAFVKAAIARAEDQ